MPSRAIRATAYDESRNELTVTFVSGRAYIYALVPPDVAAALKAAASQGAFVNAHIRDRYPHRPAKVEPRTAASSLRDALLASR